jgi:hypothetical protein
MPITLKIRPLDSKFKTSVYKVSSRRNGKLRNGEKVCLGKPVEKEGQYNYAVYKVSDSNAIVDNLGSITADQGDLSGEENNSQKLNSLEENIWNTLKAPEVPSEATILAAVAPKQPVEAPKQASEKLNESEKEDESSEPPAAEDPKESFEASEQASEAEIPADASPKGPFEGTAEFEQNSDEVSESATSKASPTPIIKPELKATKSVKPRRLKSTKKKPIEILL